MRDEARISPALLRAVVLVAALVTTAAATALVVDQMTDDAVGVDDANIYFRYAKNLASGAGLVWNPGGERVEGFTSGPWLAVCALAFKLAARPEKALLAMAVAVVAAGVTAWAARAELVLDPKLPDVDRVRSLGLWTLASLAWLAASPGFFLWTTASLLDTGLWTALLLAATFAVLHLGRSDARPWLAAALIAAVGVARPEGAALAPALLACLYVVARRRGRRALAVVVRPAAAAAAALGALFAFRRAYFGWPFPNTYYAKVSSDVGDNLRTGAAYVGAFVSAYPIAGLALLAALAGAAAWLASVASPRLAERLAPHAAWVDLLGVSSTLLLAGTAIVVWVGGDHFGSWRFMQPYWPFVFDVLLAAAALGARVVPIPKRLGAVLGGLVAIAAGSYALGPVRWFALPETTGAAKEFIIAEQGRFVGEVLTRVFAGEERPSLGVITAGALPLAYAGKSRDLLALNDVAMAHAKRDHHGPKNHAAFDVATFFRDPPDLLVLYPVIVCDLRAPMEPLAAPWAARVLRNVGDDSRFRELYTPVVISEPPLARNGKGICAYMKGATLEQWKGKALIAPMAKR